jgi:intracellular sulfur oxidation DsrE/DsrF family protein
MKACLKMHMMKRLLATLALLTTVAGLTANAAAVDDVEALLAATEAPEGVVFEIVSGDEEILGKLLPGLKADIKRLRTRFPGIPIAVVSHGAEQFALTRGNRKNEPELHAISEELVTDQNVNLHVCGTHAGWYGILPEDFPDYVDVAAAGPATINDYRALDYVLIKLP